MGKTSKKCFFIVLAVLLCASLPDSSAAFTDRSSKHVLENGLTVLIAEMPFSPVVSVYALVNAGSATEGKFLGSGISHYIEHMLFKGTHGRGVGEIAARIQAVGGRINASTGMDYTMYTITVPYGSFDVALDILSDMLMHASMEPEEVERERKVIFGEMRLNNDNPSRRLSELTFQNVYLRHPYRHPVIGYGPLLSELTREDLLEYYNTFYTPDRIILSVAGNIDSQDIFFKIQETFKGFHRRRPAARLVPQEPPQISQRRYDEEYPTDLARLSMSYAGVSLLNPDMYALDVLALILGQGRSSRLYREVYAAQGLVHDISAYNYTPLDRGLFSINCLLDRDNVEPALKAVSAQVERIKARGVTRQELVKAKRQIHSDYIFGRQTASSVTYNQAVDEAFTGDYQFSQKYLKKIDRVGKDDIKRAAFAYLTDDRLTTVVLKPKEEKPQEEALSDRRVGGAVQKFVLENGLTILLREDPTFPLVSLRLSANGGVRQEAPEFNGLSKIMALSWIKGTKRRSAVDIAGWTESLGMELDSFSGRNSFGLSVQVLTEELPAALELLSDLMFNPAFPPEEIDKIKDNLKASIRQRDDDIFRLTGHVLREALFLKHPFRLEEEGSLESVERISRDDVLSFYRRLVTAPNMVLTVFGDIDASQALKEINRRFGGLGNRPAELKFHQEDPPRQVREKIVVMKKEQAMVMFGFQGPPVSDNDYYGLEVMTSILGSSFSGRMFVNIREQLGEAYTLGADYLPGPDTGFIYMYVLTTEEQVQKVKALLKKEIDVLRREYVSERELKDCKAYLKGAFQESQETNASLSFMVGLDELYGLGFRRREEYDRRIDAVTQDDVRRLAEKYLDTDKAAIILTVPEKDEARSNRPVTGAGKELRPEYLQERQTMLH